MILSLSPLPFVGRRSNETIPLNQILNFRASERRAELVRAMPSAAENLKAKISKQISVQASAKELDYIAERSRKY